jgi:hypothetical protein
MKAFGQVAMIKQKSGSDQIVNFNFTKDNEKPKSEPII